MELEKSGKDEEMKIVPRMLRSPHITTALLLHGAEWFALEEWVGLMMTLKGWN